MNRAQRRSKRGPLHDIDALIRGRSAALLEQARTIRQSVPYPGESLADSLAMVNQAIVELEAEPSLITEPALEELRGCRSDLARRLAMH